mmetsp:Transcript_11881/g.27694  ORF Transcript_11881/g.27694 Transcript_11881/m.27694 type:complete len:706 (-) Transcript_11881:77-2194(-)
MDHSDQAPVSQRRCWIQRAGVGSVAIAGLIVLQSDSDARFFLQIPDSSAMRMKQGTPIRMEKLHARSSSSTGERWSFAGAESSKAYRAGVASLVALCAYGGYGGGGYGNRGGGGGRMQQERQREAKQQREANQFWQYQRRLLRSGPPQRNNKFWQQEERQLFKQDHVSQGINFDKYDDIPVERKGGRGNEGAVENFQDLSKQFDIPQELQDTINKCGYSVPTPVQKHSIPAGLQGTDVMVSAQTGSGKTAAFLIPLITVVLQAGEQELEEGPIYPTGVILAPTRELCQQIAHEARKLTFRTKARVCAIYGGADAMPQLRNLAEGCDIAICTPGRLEDFLTRGVVSVAKTKYLVLDEADRMLDMGFEPQIRSIVEHHNMPRPGDPAQGGRVSMMFSATFPREMQDCAMDFLDPSYLWCAVGRVGGVTENVEQRFVDCTRTDESGKFQECLAAMREVQPSNGNTPKTIVFLNTKSGVDDLTWQFADERIRAAAIHGGLTQASRDKAIKDLRDGRVSVLVATEVAARGLDLPGIDHVINYELPANVDDYVHRIGRTGRIGNTGVATSLVGSFEPAIRDIVRAVTDAGADVPQWMSAMGGGSKGGKGYGKKGRGKGYMSQRGGQFYGKGGGYGGGKSRGKGGGKYGGKGKSRGFFDDDDDDFDDDFDDFSPRRGFGGGSKGKGKGKGKDFLSSGSKGGGKSNPWDDVPW